MKLYRAVDKNGRNFLWLRLASEEVRAIVDTIHFLSQFAIAERDCEVIASILNQMPNAEISQRQFDFLRETCVHFKCTWLDHVREHSSEMAEQDALTRLASNAYLRQQHLPLPPRSVHLIEHDLGKTWISTGE